MINFTKRRKEMLADIEEQYLGIEQAQFDALVDAILEAPRVFTAGWGRAGNIVRILGMNLVHLGKTVFCVGDNSTPAIEKGDLLIIFSASGNTKTITVLCEQAKHFGAKVALISRGGTASAMGQLADLNVVIPPLSHCGRKAGCEPTECYGLTTYQTAFIVSDLIEEMIMDRTGQTLDDIWRHHNNLE